MHSAPALRISRKPPGQSLWRATRGEAKDGKRRARLKLLAGIVQIPFDELWRRERRRRVRNRTIVAVLAAAMAAFSYGMYWFLAAHAKARGLFTDISLAAEPLTFNSRIADAVWELSQSSYGVRMAALQIAASGAGGASVFLGYRDEILHAAVGLQPATRRALAGDVLDDCYGGAPEHDYTRAACAALVAALDGGSLRATRYFLERTLGKYPDLTLRGYHAPSLQDVVTGLSGKDAATVFAEALEELARAPGQDLDRLHVLAYGLVEIVRRLPAPDAARASERLLELTRDPRHTPRLPELALVLAARPGMLEAPAATRLHQLVRAQVTRRDRLFVEEALASVVRRMSREDRLAAFRSVYDGLLSGDPAWRWRELPQDEQDLPAEFWREVLASLRKAWRTASDPEQLNLIAAGLGPVPTHLCEREAAEAFDRLLSVTRAGERSKVSLGLRYAAHKLSAGDATLASRRVIGIMSQERDLDPEVLAAIPGPVEAAFVMPAFRTLLDQYSKDPQLGAYSIPPRMAALAGKMNPEAAAYFFPAVAKLQEKLERPTEFADVVLAIASALDAKHAPGARADLLHVLARMPEPPCKVLLPFISRETLPVMIEVLKWPTCPATDRDRIIEKIGGVVGRSFGSTNTAGLFRADLWGFAAWAEKQGFDLKSPPRRSIQFPPAATASQAPVP